MEISFIILNYNVTDLLRKCIQSIITFSEDVRYEIIVIDNDSPDSSWKDLKSEFPNVKFIENNENIGFSKANNKAASFAKGEFIYFLNPDTALEGHYVSGLLSFAKNQQNFGCLGIQMHDANGDFLPESKRSIPDVFNSFKKLFLSSKKSNSKSYYRNDINKNEIAKVEVITGANLLIRKEVFNVINGFDERYFMYGEDIDICYTLLQKGYQNWYYGKAKMLHYKGESTIRNDVYLERFYGAMQIFLDKYYRKEKPLQYWISRIGLKFRYFLEKRKLQ